jgi:hypothetical protein
MVVLLEVSPISTGESSVSVTMGFLVTSQMKALLPRLLRLAGRPALLSLGGSKLLPFKNDGGHCVLGDIQCCRNVFGTLPQICATTQSCLGFLRTIPFDLMAWYFGLTCSVICGTLYRQVCAFSKSCPIT